MAQMIVRNIDDEVAARFKAKARESGRSAEQLLRELIERETRPVVDEILRELDDIRQTTAGKPIVDPVAAIREDRDADHGRL